MDYTSMRQFADSWGLLFLVAVFIGAVAFTFRPGAKKHHDDAARIPLSED
jgi:cytochrome c oxidase cbb3-type subunit 4